MRFPHTALPSNTSFWRHANTFGAQVQPGQGCLQCLLIPLLRLCLGRAGHTLAKASAHADQRSRRSQIASDDAVSTGKGLNEALDPKLTLASLMRRAYTAAC